ncbi:hypothetical protein AKJ66_03000 [candidate division MSBL1 archaeon SCGC-AAA259E22]|uniref:Transmembrane protein n=1 Tax=candidate division MSBL1 archaeon SCGC-AAA259E22 TaxID=1698265 RepID=A0A133UFR0_9EURY|nr:hypothetical protein AKJ66_03000 [candidate division MSBL1 archaeon SCGC-AAA259E22]
MDSPFPSMKPEHLQKPYSKEDHLESSCLSLTLFLRLILFLFYLYGIPVALFLSPNYFFTHRFPLLKFLGEKEGICPVIRRIRKGTSKSVWTHGQKAVRVSMSVSRMKDSPGGHFWTPLFSNLKGF